MAHDGDHRPQRQHVALLRRCDGPARQSAVRDAPHNRRGRTQPLIWRSAVLVVAVAVLALVPSAQSRDDRARAPFVSMPLQYKASDGQPSRTHPARSLQGQGTPGVEYVGVHGGVSSLGYFWSYVEIGTPAQTFSVILDTGSSLTAVPCAGCDRECRLPRERGSALESVAAACSPARFAHPANVLRRDSCKCVSVHAHNAPAFSECGTHMDPKYDPSASSTSRFISCPSDDCHGTCSHNMCRYHQGYSEGSTLEGYYVTDKFWVGLEGEAYAVDFVFGCHDLETLLFKTQLADGIMGLGARDNTIVSVLQEAHNLPEFVFALCLGRHGGSFSVGGYNESLHTGPIVYTPLDPDDT